MLIIDVSHNLNVLVLVVVCLYFFLQLIQHFTNEFLLFHLFFRSKLKDTAKDESDYSDGYVTDGFATMDVFEYEVDDLSDSEDLESHGSSSGTDV